MEASAILGSKEVQSVVVDMGSFTWKAGFTGEKYPRSR
jgi:hypothetical protein